MRNAILRAGVLGVCVMLTPSVGRAQAGPSCWWAGTFCCDHTGWCYWGCPNEGGSGVYILKAQAAQMCPYHDD